MGPLVRLRTFRREAPSETNLIFEQQGQKDEEQGIPERDTPDTPAPGKVKMAETVFLLLLLFKCT